MAHIHEKLLMQLHEHRGLCAAALQWIDTQTMIQQKAAADETIAQLIDTLVALNGNEEYCALRVLGSMVADDQRGVNEWERKRLITYSAFVSIYDALEHLE